VAQVTAVIEDVAGLGAFICLRCPCGQWRRVLSPMSDLDDLVRDMEKHRETHEPTSDT
jgi:hypothetical protein